MIMMTVMNVMKMKMKMKKVDDDDDYYLVIKFI